MDDGTVITDCTNYVPNTSYGLRVMGTLLVIRSQMIGSVVREDGEHTVVQSSNKIYLKSSTLLSVHQILLMRLSRSVKQRLTCS